MKRRYLYLVFLLTVGSVAIIWLMVLRTAPRPDLAKESSPETSALQSRDVDNGGGSVVQVVQNPSEVELDSGNAVDDDVMEYVRNIQDDPTYDWKQPINFYGRVLDKEAQPVANAVISFSWNSLSESGMSRAMSESDEQGLFSLNGKAGKRLYVEVSKDGYYVSATNRIAYEFANPADGLFKPDPSRPVIFQLRNKGEGVDLITSQYGVTPSFAVPMPLDGRVIRVDLLERKVAESGFLELSQSKPPYAEWKQADIWSFRMEIPEGGFIKHSEEFPFEAPEEGYQPIVEFHLDKNTDQWATRIEQDYYFKFGNPSKYGRLQLRTSIMEEGARLTYAINPTGSRNLEPKSND